MYATIQTYAPKLFNIFNIPNKKKQFRKCYTIHTQAPKRWHGETFIYLSCVACVCCHHGMHNETESVCQIVTNNSDGPIIFFMSLPLFVGMCSCGDVCTHAHISQAGIKIETLFLVPFNFPAHTNYRLLSNRATEISSYVDSINLTETCDIHFWYQP